MRRGRELRERLSVQLELSRSQSATSAFFSMRCTMADGARLAVHEQPCTVQHSARLVVILHANGFSSGCYAELVLAEGGGRAPPRALQALGRPRPPNRLRHVCTRDGASNAPLLYVSTLLAAPHTRADRTSLACCHAHAVASRTAIPRLSTPTLHPDPFASNPNP